MRKVYLILLLLICAACAGEPVKVSKQEAATIQPGDYEEKIIPGLPIWPGYRLFGLHRKRSHEEIRQALNIEPEEPDNALKRAMTKVAIIAAVGGFIGMLVAAFLAYKAVACWDDIGVAAAISFCGGSLIAWKYSLLMWVSSLAALAFIGYLVYNAWKKHKIVKANRTLVDSFDFVKKINKWDDKAKVVLDKRLQDNDVRTLIDKEKKRRDTKRAAVIEEAVAEWEKR